MPSQRRVGSAMSDRQIAYAATSGRQVTFSFPAPMEPITGYVCGSDDFHWLVASAEGPEQIQTHLVHKGSAAMLTLSPAPTLADEPPAIRAAVEGVGRGFWLFCNKTYFGKDNEQVAQQGGTVSALAKTAHSHHSPRQQESA